MERPEVCRCHFVVELFTAEAVEESDEERACRVEGRVTLANRALNISGIHVNDGVPGKQAVRGRGCEIIKGPLPVAHFGVGFGGDLDEACHGIKPADITAQRVEIGSPVARAATNINDGSTETFAPGSHQLAVCWMRGIDGTKMPCILVGTLAVCPCDYFRRHVHQS